MNTNEAHKLIEELDTLLERERDALIAGQLDNITVIGDQKQLLITALNSAQPENPDALSGLQSKILRNQDLLDSALQGIRRVAARVVALRNVRKSLETYDETGKKNTIQGQVDRKLEKRA